MLGLGRSCSRGSGHGHEHETLNWEGDVKLSACGWLCPRPGPDHATRTISGGTYGDMSVRVACTTTVSVLFLIKLTAYSLHPTKLAIAEP